MTDKLKEYSEKLYPKGGGVLGESIRGAEQSAFIKGLQLGAEFAEWVDLSYHQTGNGFWRKYSNQTGVKFTTPELIDIFLTNKMKEHESK